MSEKIMLKPMNTGRAIGNAPNYVLNGLLSKGQPNWQIIEACDWVQSMKDCPQDGVYHAEGDVWTHTRMVVAALLADAEFKQLDDHAQYILFLSALLHDVAKPLCTFEENGRITSPKHAAIGEKVARELLWNADFETRETIAALVRLHGLPIWSIEKQNPQRAVITASLRLANHHLYLLSKADANGRDCADKEDLLLRVELFKELCLENDCFYSPKAFHNNHSRFKFFQTDDSYPSVIYDDTAFEMIILSGIAGSGKNSFYEKNFANYPTVSLDALRETHKIKPTDKAAQGKVVQLAYEQAKEYCRKKQSFVWNSTNLTADLRSKLIRTLGVYNPYFKIYYVETPIETVLSRRQNDIPIAVLQRMIRQLDMPLAAEVHEVMYVRNGF
jgi:predicted kinase